MASLPTVTHFDSSASKSLFEGNSAEKALEEALELLQSTAPGGKDSYSPTVFILDDPTDVVKLQDYIVYTRQFPRTAIDQFDLFVYRAEEIDPKFDVDEKLAIPSSPGESVKEWLEKKDSKDAKTSRCIVFMSLGAVLTFPNWAPAGMSLRHYYNTSVVGQNLWPQQCLRAARAAANARGEEYIRDIDNGVIKVRVPEEDEI